MLSVPSFSVFPSGVPLPFPKALGCKIIRVDLYQSTIAIALELLLPFVSAFSKFLRSYFKLLVGLMKLFPELVYRL